MNGTVVIVQTQIERRAVEQESECGWRQVQTHRIAFESILTASRALLYLTNMAKQQGIALPGRTDLHGILEGSFSLEKTVSLEKRHTTLHKILVVLCRDAQRHEEKI